jgi:hypothetical protein
MTMQSTFVLLYLYASICSLHPWMRCVWFAARIWLLFRRQKNTAHSLLWSQRLPPGRERDLLLAVLSSLISPSLCLSICALAHFIPYLATVWISGGDFRLSLAEVECNPNWGCYDAMLTWHHFNGRSLLFCRPRQDQKMQSNKTRIVPLSKMMCKICSVDFSMYILVGQTQSFMFMQATTLNNTLISL